MSGIHCGCTELPEWTLAAGALIYVVAETAIGSLVKKEKVPFGSCLGALVFMAGLLLLKFTKPKQSSGGEKP